VDDHGSSENRRDFLKCMARAGTGALFTVGGGIPSPIGLDAALAAVPEPAGFRFLQISDSHIGFAKPANPDARATCARRWPRSWLCRKARFHHPHRRRQSIVARRGIRRRPRNPAPGGRAAVLHSRRAAVSDAGPGDLAQFRKAFTASTGGR